MWARLNYYWRVCAVLLGYMLFAIGVVLFRVFIIPLLMVLPTQRRTRWARMLISYSLKYFLSVLELLGVLRVTIQGSFVGNWPRLVVVANHPSLLDACLLMSVFPTAEVIFKESLRNVPLLKGIFNAANYLSNGSSPSLIDTCVARLLNGGSLIVFPEGTRSEGYQMGHFKGGAVIIALRSHAQLLPVVMRCEPPIMQKGQPWYKVSPRRFELTACIGEPFPMGDDQLSECRQYDERSLGRKLTESLERYFEERYVEDRVAYE